MKKNYLLLTGCASLMLLLSIIVLAQQGVLLPQNQGGNPPQTPKRGDISNPIPDPERRDTIHGPIDVSVVFGAGESNMISGTRVIWPMAGHAYDTALPPPTFPAGTIARDLVGGAYAAPGRATLLIGSDYSKNAVIGIYDNNGLAAGAVSGIRLYGSSGSTANHTSSVPSSPPIDPNTNRPFVGEKSLGWWRYGDGTTNGNYGTLAAYNAGTYNMGTAATPNIVNGYEYYTRANPHPTNPSVPGQVISNTTTASITGTYRWWVLDTMVTAADTIKPRTIAGLDVPARFPNGSAYFSPNATTTAVPGGQPALTPTPPAGVTHLLYNPGLGSYHYFLTYTDPNGDIRGPALMQRTNEYIQISNGARIVFTSYQSAAAVLKPYFNTTIGKYVVPVYNHAVMTTLAITSRLIKDQTSFTFDVVEAGALYTSTRNANGSIDNGINLLYKIPGQFNPMSGTPSATLDNYHTVLSNAKYIRPTTVLVSGVNTLDDIIIGNVEWYAAYMTSDKYADEYVGPFWTDSTYCAHLSGWAAYKRDLVRFDTIRYNTGVVGNPAVDGTYRSNRFVDAAVRIVDNADVCVSGNVLDNTTTDRLTLASATFDDTKTSAMLVLPGLENSQGQRATFRLKIGGNADMLHTQDSNYYFGTNPLTDGMLYREVSSAAGPQSPGQPFPTSQLPVFLSGGGTNLYTEVAGINWNYVHPREDNTLTDASNPDGTKWMPYAATEASVYGVRGNYNGGTDIHTRSIANNDTTSIILFGPNTANQDWFNIYSMGMLKNFRSTCTSDCAPLAIGTQNNAYGKTPNVMAAPFFHFTNEHPLYIIHDGDGSGGFCCPGKITFFPAAVKSLSDGIKAATGGGDLHIQSQGAVEFRDDITSPEILDFTLIADNEVKILSDNNYIWIQNALNFKNADLAHLTIWAKGSADVNRGATLFDCTTGAVVVDKKVDILYDGGTNTGSGLTLIRSDNDDVLLGGALSYNNINANPESGELMVQAGQDIRIAGSTTLTQDGQRSILFEAGKTIVFGDAFNAVFGGTNDKSDGDLTIKAGYPVFLPNADLNNPMNDPLHWGPGLCATANSYDNRNAGEPAATTGGDIWFMGNANITLTPTASKFTDTYLRAFNSIFWDGDFKHTLAGKTPYVAGEPRDSIVNFAQVGNVEGITKYQDFDSVRFEISKNDNVYFLMQAGNVLGEPCGKYTGCAPTVVNEWKGNILFGNDKRFTITHYGVGPTLISAARDIENQVGANFMFFYDNPALGKEDFVKVTAGRHIETHAPYQFNLDKAGYDITNDITMEAGHQATGCTFTLCKNTELASNLGYNVQRLDSKNNDFAIGGVGQGSILAFSDVLFNFAGKGTILMTALNGKIETDPYLHGEYPANAAIVFNHRGEGKVRMEAIDIKLHGILAYNGVSRNNKNGNFEMHAFDSILTRNITYTNHTDMGSVFITTDKIKPTAPNCGEYSSATGGPGINQGHIVLGYGSDCSNVNENDKIIFDFSGNTNTSGANLYIKAGWLGYTTNRITGIPATNTLFGTRPQDLGKAYGGNITFDNLQITMATGAGKTGGYTEISTPNGNIWGKDSIQYRGINGNLLIDAGLGSIEDTERAVRWPGFPAGNSKGAGTERMLNTEVPLCCEDGYEWRTGNIMLKGGTVNFLNNASNAPGTGNVTFRTREGFIDVYDKFDAVNMSGHLLTYAGADDPDVAKHNQWGDVSERDFQYTPDVKSGSVFFGADDNIMLNYGYSNGFEPAYKFGSDPRFYDVAAAKLVLANNPFYSTSFLPAISGLCYSTYQVRVNGYLWYYEKGWKRNLHRLYRGCESNVAGQANSCSPLTGQCATINNGARPLTFNFNRTANNEEIKSGGLAVVASNYIDMFTSFTYQGGTGSGLHRVPEMVTLKGESVEGYGLYIKSLFNGANPEKRRQTCFGCDTGEDWPYIGFHDDARIHTQGQKSLIEAPLVEFFGHAELDAYTLGGPNTSLVVKADSLVFHDSMIIDGRKVDLQLYTTDADVRAKDPMRYGVVNDVNDNKFYMTYGKAITMPDRGMPVLELGYQRCFEPRKVGNASPNRLSTRGGEPTPYVGGDVIVAFKHEYALDIFNTVVANHARISFITEEYGIAHNSGHLDPFIRTDLLRIRNKVEFYTDPSQPEYRRGQFQMTTTQQMPSVNSAGMYPRHVHLEPNSELSIPGEDSLSIISTTTIGGYGEVHENIYVKANGIIAPGYASLMEFDCQSGKGQGKLTTHNLTMEKDAVLRISIGNRNENCQLDKVTNTLVNCTQTDTLYVKDSIFFHGKIPMYVLMENEYVEPGCYLFLIYDDLGTSSEYVNNLELKTPRLGDYFFGLDKSEPGRVYLCVTKEIIPIIQRYVLIHAVEGIITNPASNVKHFVKGHEDFKITVDYGLRQPLVVQAEGYYSKNLVQLPAVFRLNNEFEYTIRQVVEPWDVYFGGVDYSIVGNETIVSPKVWAYRNTLFINVETDDVVSIYNMTGVMIQKMEIPAGLKKLTLEKGVYVVMLKDGSVHRIIIN